jgi:nucleoid-associated protein YgaU
VPIGSGSTARPASNEPAVTVYDEQTYTAQPGDTFESISKKFLNSGNYSKALQMHNQNHARAGREMSNTGKLTPGEKIYIPPVGILEQRYAGAIANTAPPSIQTTGGIR